jgi:hypothetical protein
MSLNIELIGNLIMLKFVEGHQMSLGRRAALGRVDAFESRPLRRQPEPKITHGRGVAAARGFPSGGVTCKRQKYHSDRKSGRK